MRIEFEIRLVKFFFKYILTTSVNNKAKLTKQNK